MMAEEGPPQKRLEQEEFNKTCPYLAKLGVSETSWSELHVPYLEATEIIFTNGSIAELQQLILSASIPITRLCDIVQNKAQGFQGVNFEAIRIKIARTVQKCTDLRRNRSGAFGARKLDDFMQKPFTHQARPVPQNQAADCDQAPVSSSLGSSSGAPMVLRSSLTNSDIARLENQVLQLSVDKDSLLLQTQRLKQLAEYRRGLYRRYYQRYKRLLKNNSAGSPAVPGIVIHRPTYHNAVVQENSAESSKRRRVAISRNAYRCRSRRYAREKNQLNTTVSSLTRKIRNLETENRILSQDSDSIETALKEMFSRTKTDGHYRLELRGLCMELNLNYNVAVRKVGPMLQEIFRSLLGISNVQFPSPSTVVNIIKESMVIAQKQILDVLVDMNKDNKDNSHNTPFSDGTTKHGIPYHAIGVSTVDQNLLLSVHEVSDGTAAVILKAVDDSLNVATRNNAETKAKIVLELKNVMSDRSRTQTKFNQLFVEYRKQLLPLAVQNWETLPDEEKESVGVVYAFYCGLHFVTGMYSVTDKALSAYHSAHSSGKEHVSPGCVLIRDFALAFSNRGDQTKGRPHELEFYAEDVKILPFFGNRETAHFLNAKRIYYCRDQALKCLEDILLSSEKLNNLLQGVKNALTSPEAMSTVKAMGLVGTLIIMPLWEAVETTKHIELVSAVYQAVYKFFVEASKDDEMMDRFMSNEISPFTGIDYVIQPMASEDKFLARLIVPDYQYDAECQIQLSHMFKGFAALCEKWVPEHLEGGCYSSMDATMKAQTASVPGTNAASERALSILDRSLNSRPSASNMYHENLVLWVHNKPADYLRTKSKEEQIAWYSEAMKNKDEYYRLAKKRIAEVSEARYERLQQRIVKAQGKIEKRSSLVSEITQEMTEFGYHQTKNDFKKKYTGLKTEEKRRRFCENFLKFHRQVLRLRTKIPRTLALTHNREKKSLTTLKENCLTAIAEQLETDKKVNERLDIAGSYCKPEELVGKKIEHLFKDETSDSVTWYNGTIVRRVFGCPRFFEIVYDGENDAKWVFDLYSDYKEKCLKFL